MSWLGGSLSSLTGQLSSLTKDILTEGTEETTDTGTELRIEQEKNRDLQNVIATLNSENERLKHMNHDLEEKAESSELQINTISQQYRLLLEEKQTEIKKLKEKQNELLQHQTSSDYHQTGSDYHLPSGYHPTSPNGTRDDLDFSDSINMQHEINRLRKENSRLQTLCDQLKSAAKSDVKAFSEDKHQKEIEDLQKILKETCQQLAAEKENHQHEVASLQDIHSQKASVLRKKFKDEITQYKQKIKDLEQTIADSACDGYLQPISTESAEYLQLQEQLGSLEHDHKQLNHEYEKVCTELKHAKNQLLDQLDSNHQRELNSEINDLESEQDRVFSEADSMVTELGSEQSQKLTSDILDNIEKENMLLKKKNLELQEQIVILEKSVQTITEERKQYVGKTIGDDITRLHDQLKAYQEEVLQFDAVKADLQSEKEALEGVLMDLRGQLKEMELNLKEMTLKFKKQEKDFELLKEEKDQLEESLNESKLELSQTEFITTTLTLEKEELQKSLEQSKEFLALNDNAQELKEKLLKKSQELEELAVEKSELETSLEELDSQHQEAMNQVIAIKKDLSGQVEKLQTRMQELMKENKQLSDKVDCQQRQIQQPTLNDSLITELKEQVSRQEQQLREAGETKEQLMSQLLQEQQENKENIANVDVLREEISRKDDTTIELSNRLKLLQTQNEEKIELIKSLQEKTQKLQQQVVSLEELIKEQDTLVSDLEDKNKLVISLERKVQEKDEHIVAVEEKYNFVNEKLQQGSETEASNFLHRISDLQNTLSDKELSVNKLKSQCEELTLENQTLQGIVDKLKEEREINDKKFNEMKEKFNNGAMTINELHMDIKEMKENLSQADTNLNEKNNMIKLLREENTSLKETLKEIVAEKDLLKHAVDAFESESGKLTSSDEVVKLKLDLEMKTNEILTLSQKCSLLTDTEKEFSIYKQQTNAHIDGLNKKLAEKEEEISSFKLEISAQKSELEEFQEEISLLKTEFDHKVRDLKTENLSLENKVSHLQQTLNEKIEYYENLIKELQSGRNDTISEENKNLIKIHVEKDLLIKNLNDEISNLKTMLSDAEKLTESNSVDFVAKVQTISDLKEDLFTLSTENEICQTKIQQQISEIEDLQNIKEKLEFDVENLTSKMKNLTAEYNVAFETISKLKNEIKGYQNTIEDQKSGIIELNDKCQNHVQSLKEKDNLVNKQEGMLAIFQQATVEKDEQIDYLNRRMKKALSLLGEDNLQLLDMEDLKPNYSLPALEYPEKGSLEQGEKGQVEVTEEIVQLSSRVEETVRDFEETDTRSVIRDMEDLQSLIKQKDDVIKELQKTNASLLKMVESKSVSSADKAIVDIHRLENEVRSLKIEREQIMAVMNEKSREASSLKSEVHRLMNVVAAEKSAIEKLQKDMIQGPGTEDKSDMQKQALQNLSRLIRDKDLEIEALKQKNETLLAVLQDSSSNGTEIGSLMQDKENLARQLKVFQDERDQMVTFVNQKHEESLKYHQEVQRLTQYINTELAKHNQIQQQYANLAPQFEDKKQALLKAQNDLINYKQKYTELEVKYGEMVQKVNTSDTIDITSYNAQSDELKRAQEKIKELNESLQETEQKVTALHQQNVEYEEEISKRDVEVNAMRKQIDILTFQLQGVKVELTDLKQEHSLSEKETSEQVSHLQMLKEANNRLTLELQNREFEMKSLHEKLLTLSSVVDGQKDEEGQINKLLQENESVMAQVKELQQERHQTLMALKQRQIETQELQRECQKLKDKEIKYSKELERLRGHLLQMEEAYTKDALESEEREKDLRNRLANAEEKVLSSSSVVQAASQQAVQQVESLRQQLYTVASQRDQAYLQLSSLQDQCQQYAVSLSNLQLVLEQFQRDKDGQVASEVEKLQRENTKLQHSVTELRTELQIVKEKLLEAEDGLEAAVRLHQQLDKCDQIIAALKEEVQIREASLKNAEVEISDLRSAKDSKVDKMILKNMLLGYFTAPKNQQNDVLHTIGSLLNFTPTEFDKVLGSGGKGGWVPGFLRFGSQPATPPTTPTRRHTVTAADNADRSFSELFVKFLETESSPKQPVMKLPAEEMALDVQRHHKPVFNPFTAPRHVNQEERQVRDEQHLLMPSSPLSSTLPVFSPVAQTRPIPPKTSSAILNDVLASR